MSWYVIINNEYSGQPATRYITGFAGSTSVLIFLDDNESICECDPSHKQTLVKHSQILKNLRMLCKGYLLVDSRYWGDERKISKSNSKISELEIVKISREYTAKQALSEIIANEKIDKIVIDGSITSHASYIKLHEQGVEVLCLNSIFETMRSIKSSDEQKFVKIAIKIAEGAFARVRPYIVVGATESEISARLEYEMKLGGAEKAAFDTIVASGRLSAVPHAQTSNKKIESADSVIVDFGCFYNGYASDLTKTILMPNASEELYKTFGVVQKAHDMAVSAIKPGIPAKDIDYVARKIIDDAGYGDKFVHSTGHGVGVSVHESPHIGANSEDILEKGNIITIEPGIYLPGTGGVRIETTEIVR